MNPHAIVRIPVAAAREAGRRYAMETNRRFLEAVLGPLRDAANTITPALQSVADAWPRDAEGNLIEFVQTDTASS